MVRNDAKDLGTIADNHLTKFCEAIIMSRYRKDTIYIRARPIKSPQ